jgi:hypothetical protein
MMRSVLRKISAHKWKITTLAQTGIIVFLLVFAFYPKPPLIQIEIQVETPVVEIAPSLMEPSFLYFFYNGNILMGGMWAIFNGTRSIDIRNITLTDPPYSTVPQGQYIDALQGARLDYIPMLPTHRLIVFYRDNSSTVFTIDDAHGCDFYRAFYNQTWSGTVHFRYTIKVEPW